jgi:methylenetetrahydrofolate dehydrogenase (NADP+)/methenyltetrahydrofolate cyclohydrolase
MKILDGKTLSLEIQLEIKEKVSQMVGEGKRAPHLAAILVGTDGGSETYVNKKLEACNRCGFKSTLIRFDADVEETTLLNQINKLNNDDELDGFIVQLPLPKHINESKIIESINPLKDVDGFHPINFGKMSQNIPAFLPATPYGILQLLERNGIETEGKHCVVLGRSNIVGLPMCILLARKAYPGNCTVTICHSKTKNIEYYTKQADIIVAALGIPEFLKANMVKEGAVVIDVGTTRVKDDSKKSGFTLKGDVKFDEVAPKCSHITPVPGGVGPMTVTSLLMNTLLSASKTFN